MSYRFLFALAVAAVLLAACDTADAPNRGPAFVELPEDATAVTGQPWRGDLQAVDADGDEVALRLLEAPAWLTLTTAAEGRGTLAGTPRRKDAGPAMVRVEAGDGDRSRVYTLELHVVYDFAGVYADSSFSYAGFFSGCYYTESDAGGYYRLTLSPRGEAMITFRIRQGNPENLWRGTYHAAGDTLVVETQQGGGTIAERWHIAADSLVFVDSTNLPSVCRHRITAIRL